MAVHTIPAKDRLDKWDKKFNTARIKEILDDERPRMKEKAEVVFTELAAVEDATKAILNSIGISQRDTANYLAYARQVWKLDRTYEGETLRLAVQTLIDRWVARGLAKSTLEAIREDVFTIGSPVAPE
jgi:hypothetical protein